MPTKSIDYLPKNKNCPKDIILCESDAFTGSGLENISKLTSQLNKLFTQAGTQDIMTKVVNSIEQFDSTQKNLDELIIKTGNL